MQKTQSVKLITFMININYFTGLNCQMRLSFRPMSNTGEFRVVATPCCVEQIYPSLYIQERVAKHLRAYQKGRQYILAYLCCCIYYFI
jgi:hypothetical protein